MPATKHVMAPTKSWTSVVTAPVEFQAIGTQLCRWSNGTTSRAWSSIASASLDCTKPPWSRLTRRQLASPAASDQDTDGTMRDADFALDHPRMWVSPLAGLALDQGFHSCGRSDGLVLRWRTKVSITQGSCRTSGSSIVTS